MKRLLIMCSLSGLALAWGGVARADGILDTVKNIAAKPEVQAAAKSGAGKAVDMVRGNKTGTTGTTGTGTPAAPGAPNPQAAGSVDNINNDLLDASRKNQCAFKSNSDVLEAGCDAKAAGLANAMMRARMALVQARVMNYKFEVSAHTETGGNVAANKALSEKRAAAIAKLLSTKGVPADQLVSVGMGAEKPLVSPDKSAAQKAQNRRYEIRVKL